LCGREGEELVSRRHIILLLNGPAFSIVVWSPSSISSRPSLKTEVLCMLGCRDAQARVVAICDVATPLRQVSCTYAPLLPCHSLACFILACHLVHCIIMFSKLASVPISQFLPLSVLSPDTLARARGMSEIVFYKWPENVLGMG